ncbi:hypothetical protein GALMADRAFT_86570 [Galerina marginata CBS 339.88]|uniref:Uncharacterized protein n=1 Tax=Galerina marginata (strain CBS 339.88) TaxID=685588 RepID=A0A067TVC7_GALM3|nr:hypothetical protein GALMADRAFT_86570 [Galerina marginata CBS 339.88]
MANASAIPDGHTFLEVNTFVSIKGKDIAEKLLQQAENRNPDAFDMYIYNDFFSYGVLELVDKTLATLHTKIKKKEWEEAYYILEGLVTFVDFEPAWAHCDDGDRVDITNRTIGVCAIAVLCGLDDNDLLHSVHFPSLENLLKRLVSLSEGMDCQYGLPCKAIARRVFQDKSEAEMSLDITRLNEWAIGLEADEKEKAKAQIEKMIEEKAAAAARGKRVKPWYAKGDVCDENDSDPDFKLSRVWKDYKECLSGVPRLPMRGPPKWDLSKWSAAERRAFEFGAMDDD